MADREFKPGIIAVTPRPKIACIWSTKIEGTRFRCTDAALDEQLYCAVHLREREAKKNAIHEAREKKAKSWWPF